MGVCHRRGQLLSEVDGLFYRELLLARQHRPQRLAIDVLHDHIWPAAIGGELDRTLDAGVLEVARYLQLSTEPVEGGNVAHDRFVWALEDDLTSTRILGQEDVAEGAVADRLHDRELV